jgi:uncharacterized membrane protein
MSFMSRRKWAPSRNCSISLRRPALVYAALCGAAFTVATIFTLRGAWYVLWLAILEMSVVEAAFSVCAARGRRECIVLADDWLAIASVWNEQVGKFRLDPRRRASSRPHQAMR